MMGVESLLREVEQKRSKALEALEAEYDAKRAEVKKRSAEQISYIAESATKEGASLSQKEMARVDGAAKLRSKKIIFDATEKLLENNVDLLREELAGFARSAQYRELLVRMVDYAGKRLGGKISVLCRKEDEADLKAAGAKIAAGGLAAIGGFKAESADGTLELDLTFEEVLRSRGDEVRAAILGKE